jgi:hypothetical protein
MDNDYSTKGCPKLPCFRRNPIETCKKHPKADVFQDSEIGLQNAGHHTQLEARLASFIGILPVGTSVTETLLAC